MPFGYVPKPVKVVEVADKENVNPNKPLTRHTILLGRQRRLSVIAENKKKRKADIDEFIEKNTSIAMRIRHVFRNEVTPQLPTPVRSGRILSNEVISLAVRVVVKLSDEKDRGKTVSTNGVIERASDYLDIGPSKLRELRDMYVAVNGTALPMVQAASGPKKMRAKIGNEWFGPLREEISRVRMDVGKAVEIPHVIQWFRDVHQMTVTRIQVYHSLKKMGFLFGKTKKLLLRRESDRITALRREYLKSRLSHDAIIAKRRLGFVNHAEGIEGPNERQICYLYLDESYVNRNHCRGETWYHPEDQYGCACNLPSGKGERLVMLTGITAEYGMLELDTLSTLMLFQARKSTGDYHANMDGDMFIKWWKEYMSPALEKHCIEVIPVMDNAAYHTTPAEGSINAQSFTTKKQCTDLLDKYNIPYVQGRAPVGDNLDQLKVKLMSWLKENAVKEGIKMNLTRFQECCQNGDKNGKYFQPIMTPPYHPELQPIEELWRDVKCLVARKFAGARTVRELREHVEDGFKLYGTAEKTKNKIKRARDNETRYIEKGVYADVVDLTLSDESEDDNDIVENDSSSDEDN